MFCTIPPDNLQYISDEMRFVHSIICRIPVNSSHLPYLLQIRAIQSSMLKYLPAPMKNRASNMMK